MDTLLVSIDFHVVIHVAARRTCLPISCFVLRLLTKAMRLKLPVEKNTYLEPRHYDSYALRPLSCAGFLGPFKDCEQLRSIDPLDSRGSTINWRCHITALLSMSQAS